MIKRLCLALGLLAIATMLSSCGENYPGPNYDTPEKAIETIENAYRQKDKKKILWCKNFMIEAKFIVPDDPSRLGGNKAMTADQISKMQKINMKILKAKFISDLDAGIPEWNGVKSKVTNVRKLTDDMVVVSENIVPPNQDVIKSEMFVGKGPLGQWKVLMPYSKEMEDNWMKYYGKD